MNESERLKEVRAKRDAVREVVDLIDDEVSAGGEVVARELVAEIRGKLVRLEAAVLLLTALDRLGEHDPEAEGARLVEGFRQVLSGSGEEATDATDHDVD